VGDFAVATGLLNQIDINTNASHHECLT